MTSDARNLADNTDACRRQNQPPASWTLIFEGVKLEKGKIDWTLMYLHAYPPLVQFFNLPLINRATKEKFL